MSFLFQPLHVFVAVLIEYVRKQQEMVIEWLNGLFGIPSYSEAIPIVAETSHKATQETPKSICINIFEVADTEIHLARAPPSPAGPLPSMLTAIFVVRLELGTRERCARIVP